MSSTQALVTTEGIPRWITRLSIRLAGRRIIRERRLGRRKWEWLVEQ